MRRTIFLLVSLSLFIATVAAAHERKETIHYPSLGGEASGYLSLPTSHGNHPAIIVIQEWWGLNDWVKEQADRFAAKGYVATRKQDGWLKSAVFEKSFRLVQSADELGHPQYTLEVR